MRYAIYLSPSYRYQSHHFDRQYCEQKVARVYRPGRTTAYHDFAIICQLSHGDSDATLQPISTDPARYRTEHMSLSLRHLVRMYLYKGLTHDNAGTIPN